MDLDGSRYLIPPDGSLTLPVDVLVGIDRFVMVENLAVLLGAHLYQMPEELAGVTWVFRGSPQFSPATAAMLAEETPNVFYFPDTDPQGLANSLNTANCSGVISCTLDGLHEIKADGLDKPHDYMNQMQMMEGLTRLGHPLALVLGDLRTRFSQESMARRPLRVWHGKGQD